jgi:hypothetical protein
VDSGAAVWAKDLSQLGFSKLPVSPPVVHLGTLTFVTGGELAVWDAGSGQQWFVESSGAVVAGLRRWPGWARSAAGWLSCRVVCLLLTGPCVALKLALMPAAPLPACSPGGAAGGGRCIQLHPHVHFCEQCGEVGDCSLSGQRPAGLPVCL